MKKILLTALFAILSLGSIYAQSTMTDDQVIKFIVKEHQTGSSQQQIVTKLMQKGVDIDQIRRVRKKYERMQKNDGMGSIQDKSLTEDEQIDARLRRNNAKDKSELTTTEKLQDEKLSKKRKATKDKYKKSKRYISEDEQEMKTELDDFLPDSLDLYDRMVIKNYLRDKELEEGKTGKKVFECEGAAEDFHEGLAAVVRNLGDSEDDFTLRTGFVDKKGKEVIPFIFKHTGQFSEGLCWAETDDAIGFINREGKFVITGDYKTIVLEEGMECGESPLCPTFSEGLAWVSNKDGKFGYIDKTGKVVVPFRYEPWVEDDMFLQGPCYDFHGGLARVWDKNTQKYGYIDRTGKEVFPCQFDEAEDISEGIAVVGIDANYGFIDAKGNCTLKR